MLAGWLNSRSFPLICSPSFLSFWIGLFLEFKTWRDFRLANSQSDAMDISDMACILCCHEHDRTQY